MLLLCHYQVNEKQTTETNQTATALTQ